MNSKQLRFLKDKGKMFGTKSLNTLDITFIITAKKNFGSFLWHLLNSVCLTCSNREIGAQRDEIRLVFTIAEYCCYSIWNCLTLSKAFSIFEAQRWYCAHTVVQWKARGCSIQRSILIIFCLWALRKINCLNFEWLHQQWFHSLFQSKYYYKASTNESSVQLRYKLYSLKTASASGYKLLC